MAKIKTLALVLLFLILAALIVILLAILTGMWGEVDTYRIMIIR